MIDAVEQLLDGYAHGRLSRRDAAALITAVALAPLGLADAARAAEAGEPTFRATGLNHLGLRVPDVERSRDFYQRHLGMSVIRDNSPGNCFLRLGTNYMGLFRSRAPAVDHFCFTVEDYDPDTATAKLQGAGLTTWREEDRVYFEDPDGLHLQLDSRFGSWPGPPPV